MTDSLRGWSTTLLQVGHVILGDSERNVCLEPDADDAGRDHVHAQRVCTRRRGHEGNLVDYRLLLQILDDHGLGCDQRVGRALWLDTLNVEPVRLI